MVTKPVENSLVLILQVRSGRKPDSASARTRVWKLRGLLRRTEIYVLSNRGFSTREIANGTIQESDGWVSIVLPPRRNGVLVGNVRTTNCESYGEEKKTRTNVFNFKILFAIIFRVRSTEPGRARFRCTSTGRL